MAFTIVWNPGPRFPRFPTHFDAYLSKPFRKVVTIAGVIKSGVDYNFSLYVVNLPKLYCLTYAFVYIMLIFIVDRIVINRDTY